MGRERGQATVEWVGLIAAVGLALAALVAGASGGLTGGEAAAQGGREAHGLGAVLAERITCAARDLCGAERAAHKVGLPPPTRPRPRRIGAKSSPRVRQLAGVVDKTWLVCFGYRSLRYEIDHPRSPREAMPTGDALEIVNDCLNPWQFLFG